MKLRIEWMPPSALHDGTKQNLIYTTDLKRLPAVAGIYIFGRSWGRGLEAIYVGKANQIRGRVNGQLKNLPLMLHLKNARTGKRVVLTGRVVPRPGQRIQKCLVLIERALIRYFLSEGHDLVNKQGARIQRHEIESSGKVPKRFMPSLMYVEKAKGE